jgi:hypothetical protein
MNLTKRQLFKRKNRSQLYTIYEDTITAAYEIAERYESELTTLRNRKADFRSNTHIWNILNGTELDNTRTFESCAYIKCCSLKRNAVTVTVSEYQSINDDIYMLSKAIGNIRAVLDFVNYIERKELTVRAK